MPKGSEELTNARKEEIIDACAQLYAALPFKDITLGAIGAKTSFTRTSIYNYFRTKEEIFLALLQREYAAWCKDLDSLAECAPLSAEDFASRFSDILAGRGCMLKLMSMNLYDIEDGSRLENLVEFKRVYHRSLNAVCRCLAAHFPASTDEDRRDFVYAFFPFLFGVYPYTNSTEKQAEAMKIAGVAAPGYDISTLTRALTLTLTRPFR